jgi:hypothetical protein
MQAEKMLFEEGLSSSLELPPHISHHVFEIGFGLVSFAEESIEIVRSRGRRGLHLRRRRARRSLRM